ncbi:neuroligin-4, X-linked [Parasteatoda tepidariorum]|uniref:neuroligin-4, X-linked n=1 Tax=Parasteatoda tepidariorum TaxID=114398 RepID=UPI001C71902A|nr:neuroligin-4, X-linked [Parasteatoda tepidariorum]
MKDTLKSLPMRLVLIFFSIIFRTYSINQMELDTRHLSTRVVHTRYGTLRGFISTLSNRQLQPVEVFLGVPYAGAPTGALRFMPPVTSPHWKGVRVADSFGSVCPQKWPDIKNETDALKRMPQGRLRYLQRILPLLTNQSEDCLYLNIYAPAIVGRQPLQLPVMVFIHGESYEWNAGNPYDGRVLASYGNVVVVTINYRLGVLGFLPAVDRSARGNYGLMDQVAALHWIQDNIAEFGGDPNNVTVFGQGHGAACINLLMLSPMAKGLFQRVILQSGSALCPWAIAKDAVDHTRRLAQALNCSMQDSMTLIECLRKRQLEEIMSVDIPAPDHLSAFGPTVDGIVLPRDPVYLMETKPDLFLRHDLMLGTTKVESFFMFSAVEEIKGINTHRRDRIIRTMVRNLFTHHLQQIFLTIVNEYMDWSVPHLHTTDIFRGTVEALSDATVLSPVITTGMLHSNPNFPTNTPLHNPVFFMPKKTYFYVFTHQTEEGDYLQRLGCLSGEDLSYVFGAPLVTNLAHFTNNYTADEVALSEVTMMHWTSFAKFGDPNIGTQLEDLIIDITRGRYERVVWPEFTSTHQKFLSISLKPKVKDHYNAHKLSYWLNLIPALDTADNTTTDQHHMLPEHHNTSAYDGNIRNLYDGVQQLSMKSNSEDTSSLNGTIDQKNDLNRNVSANSSEVYIFSLDKASHLSALGVTIAVGCSLLMLNVVVFAGIYYQKDKIAVARNVQKAFYETERAESEEDPAYKKPYLLKDAPASLILHDFDTLQAFKDQPMFDLVESSEIKRHLSGSTETELTNTSKPAKIKTVTFVDPPTILCDIPKPILTDVISPEQMTLKSLLKTESEAGTTS